MFNRSDVIWEEQNKKGRWKAMKVRISDELEAAWTTIESEKSLRATPNYIYKFDDWEVTLIVDFLYGKLLRHSSFQRMRTRTTRSESLCAAGFLRYHPLLLFIGWNYEETVRDCNIARAKLKTKYFVLNRRFISHLLLDWFSTDGNCSPNTTEDQKVFCTRCFSWVYVVTKQAGFLHQD